MGCFSFCSPRGAPSVAARTSAKPVATRQRVELNVGGQHYTTSRGTLLRYSGTSLAELLDGEPEEDGVYFVDRDGRLFAYILNFLRDGMDFTSPTSPEDLLALRREAKQLRLTDLVRILDDLRSPSRANGRVAPSVTTCERRRAEGPTDLPLGCSPQRFPDPRIDDRRVEGQTVSVNPHNGLPPSAQPELRPAEPPLPEPPPGTDYRGAPTPANEMKRLAKVESLNIFGGSAEIHCDSITSVVAALLDVPMVLISIVTKDEQRFKSKVGLKVDATPRNVSFCAFLLTPEQPSRHGMLVVEDAHFDHRFCDNPIVTGEPFIRFYAGCPLVTSEGLRLGALCAIDRVPRSLGLSQAQVLVNFGQLAVQALEQRQLESRPLDVHPEEDGEENKASDGEVKEPNFNAGSMREQRMREAMSEIVVLIWARPDSKDWNILYANKAWTDNTAIFVSPPQRFPGEVKFLEVAKDGSLTYKPSSTSLWDFLRPAKEEAGKFQKLCKAVSATMADASFRQPMLSLAADLNIGGPGVAATLGSGPSVPVLCRFSPASVPLDVAAAAIRPGVVSHNEVAANVQPKGFPPGLLYFCVMRVQRSQPPTSLVSPAPLAAPTPEQALAPGVQTVASPPEGTSLFEESGKRLDLSSLRKGALAAGIPRAPSQTVKMAKQDGEETKPSRDGWRPPVSPYEDVRVLRLAGEGSFGKVYFGLWNGLAVAVKVISNLSTTHQKLTLSPDVEAELSSLVSHPNLVKTYQYCTRTVPDDSITGEDEERKLKAEMWIVQEWCDGGTLRKFCKLPRVDEGGVLEAAEIGLEIAQAVEYLHSRNVIHGDLTPNNILLSSFSTRKGYICKVCDFGRARIFDSDTQEIMTRTMGTVTHMPPELFVTNIDACVLTPKADVYALGVVLYEVVTAKPPFSGLSPPQVVLRVASGKRLELPREVAPELVCLYRSCVARQPKDRPTAAQLVQALESFYQTCQGNRQGER